jgi:hypothetical protein
LILIKRSSFSHFLAAVAVARKNLERQGELLPLHRFRDHPGRAGQHLKGKHRHFLPLEMRIFPVFTRVGTYVQRGSNFCFVVLVVVLVVLLVVGKSLIKILLYLPILFNFTMLSSLLKILHYCPISPCIQQPCPAALPGMIARQP